MSRQQALAEESLLLAELVVLILSQVSAAIHLRYLEEERAQAPVAAAAEEGQLKQQEGAVDWKADEEEQEVKTVSACSDCDVRYSWTGFVEDEGNDRDRLVQRQSNVLEHQAVLAWRTSRRGVWVGKMAGIVEGRKHHVRLNR